MANQLPALMEREKANILSRFPRLNDWLTPEIWWSIVESLRTNPKLNEAADKNPNSVVQALLTLADWGLKPDGTEAFINVYNEKQIVDGKEVRLPTAQAQWIWQGSVRRAVDSGVIAHAVADIIREGDTIEEIVDQKGRHLSHRRDIGKGNRKIIGSYALFWLRNGLMDYELCDLEDIERAKAASLRQAGKVSPAWQYAYPEQGKKTALRRGLKRMVGKRDAGFAKLLEAQTQFETNDYEELPDDLPTGEDSQPGQSHKRDDGGGAAGSPASAASAGRAFARNTVETVIKGYPEDEGDRIESLRTEWKKNRAQQGATDADTSGASAVGGRLLNDAEQADIMSRWRTKHPGEKSSDYLVIVQELFNCEPEELRLEDLPEIEQRLGI